MRSTRAWARATSIAIALALAAVGCANRPLPAPPPPPPPPPPPDSDGTPQESKLLQFGVRHPDTLHRTGADLDDWYRIEVSAPGSVRLALSGPQQAALPHLTLALTDASGMARVEPTRSGGRARVELAREVERGTYLVWVGTEPAAAAGVVRYELEAYFLPRPPPPKPVVRNPPPKARVVEPPPPPPPPVRRFETRVTTLVEVERPRDDGQFAMIKGGEQMGFRPGLRGRLVDGDRTLGTFEIIEVYAGGSRVKIQGRLSGPVSGRTAVQVDVPTGP